MNTTIPLDPEEWAEQTFGQVQVQDRRHPRRAVQAVCGMVRDLAASLPTQQRGWKAVKALYRLLDEPDVTFDALRCPHWQQTRAELAGNSVVLLVQDTTDLRPASRIPQLS